MSEPEKAHIISAAQFELSKCFETQVQQAALDRMNLVSHDLAKAVAEALIDVKVPAPAKYHGNKSSFLSQVDGKSQSKYNV